MFPAKILLNLRRCSWQKFHYSTKSKRKTLSQRKQCYGDSFPDKLLNKKQITPSVMYLTNDTTATTIDKALDPYFRQSPCDTIMELNPGISLFTRKLLDREDQFRKILLMESMDFFMDNLQELHSLYPDRVKVRHADMISIWKLLYQDKMDNGTRIKEILRDVPRKPHNDDPNMLMFGVIGSYVFFKHLINSVVFQHSLLSLGRTEMYVILPPPLYLHLSCTNEIGYMVYRSTTILFQILFEHRFIAYLPREDFLPVQAEYNVLKNSKLGKVHSINPDKLCLVRIVPRRNIFDFISAEDLPALWYFVKQNCISRRNRIIPNLEKWIPGCGPRLIVNKKQSELSKPVYSTENDIESPQYSSPCMSISNRDYFPNINIYTQFGDLTPSQFLTLFTLFRQWPEYGESSFLASFENNMLKMEGSAEYSVDGIAEDDDDITEDSPNSNRSLKDAPLNWKPRKSSRINKIEF